ncbi:hypothetical protein [Kocuria sp.]|uniref:hypothetical protein n=1 Tax=Kocuria sp. TaxID=1871328 RepID=UPI00289871EA|nr:hypothetical protein [Kocuria sp.]
MTERGPRRQPRNYGERHQLALRVPIEVWEAATHQAAEVNLSMTSWFVSLAARATGFPEHDQISPPAQD